MPSADDPQGGENMGTNDELTVEDFLAWWWEALRDAEGDHFRFLRLVAMGFVVSAIVRDPQPLLDELDRLNGVLTEVMFAAAGRDDIASGEVWPPEGEDESDGDQGGRAALRESDVPGPDPGDVAPRR